MPHLHPDSLIARLSAPPNRGAPAAPISMSIVRELVPADLARLPLAMPQSPPPIKQAREIHHRQAMLLARGLSAIEVAAACGTTPQRLSSLQVDPTFQELIAYYRDQINVVEIETARRVQARLLDIHELAAIELQDRLEDDKARAALPASELRKIAEYAGDRTAAPPRGTTGAPTAPPARVELKFSFAALRAAAAPKLTEPEPVVIDAE